MNYNWDRGALASESRNKRNEASSLSGVIVDAEKNDHGMFLLVGVKKDIWPVKLQPKPFVGKGQLGLPGKWPLKRLCVCVCVCVCVSSPAFIAIDTL